MIGTVLAGGAAAIVSHALPVVADVATPLMSGVGAGAFASEAGELSMVEMAPVSFPTGVGPGEQEVQQPAPGSTAAAVLASRSSILSTTGSTTASTASLRLTPSRNTASSSLSSKVTSGPSIAVAADGNGPQDDAVQRDLTLVVVSAVKGSIDAITKQLAGVHMRRY